ncbi:putative transmembrane protein [Mycoplasmopsis bovis HB0801]|nr:putative transmembrane protein [Mycoplasmopsis bovis HB0801]
MLYKLGVWTRVQLPTSPPFAFNLCAKNSIFCCFFIFFTVFLKKFIIRQESLFDIICKNFFYILITN